MRLTPLLRLLRFPALFTTFPDVLAGYAIVRQGQVDGLELTALLVSSGLLYLSGMVFNDVFDVVQDTEERPTRPIPAGEISRRAAAMLGGGLMLGGIIAAAFVSLLAVIVALMLAGTILAYDAGGKKTPAGPVLMGICRGLNVLLGAACLESFQSWAAHPALIVAGIMAFYVCGITLFARTEAKESRRGPLIAGWGLCLAALFGWGIVAATWATGPAVRITLLMLILIGFQISRRMSMALRTRQPQHVQQAIRVLLLTIPMLEAIVIIAHGGPDSLPLAIAAALMMIPGQILSKFIPMT